MKTQFLLGLIVLLSSSAMAQEYDLLLKGGHVSLVAGMNAVTRLWPKVNEWLSVRSI